MQLNEKSKNQVKFVSYFFEILTVKIFYGYKNKQKKDQR